MGRFLSPLTVEQVTPGDGASLATWRLLAPFAFDSSAVGVIEVPAGFVTNFCSVPRAPLTAWLFGDMGDRAGTLHDWLYTSRLDRSTCDAVLYEALLADSVPRWRAWCMWQGVRLGGASHYEGTGSND